MKFSEKIVRLRKIKGITQDEFASAVGVSRQAVYKWECGQSYPEAAKLIEIKALFGISIDDLLDENYEVPLPEKKRKKRSPKAVAKNAEAEIAAEVAPKEEKPEKVVVVEVVAEPVVSSAEEVHEQTVAEAAEKIVEEAIAAPAEEPATVAATVAEQSAAEPVQEAAPEKKKGFFSRLFGRK